MEIVINGRFLTQGITGVQRYALELVQAIDSILETRSDLKVTVISPRLSKPPPSWRNVVLREGGHLQGHAWEQLELPWLSRGKTLFCPGNTAPIVSVLGSQRIIVTVHDLSYRYFPSAYSRAFRMLYGIVVPLVLRHANAVITVSESERTSIVRLYPTVLSRLHAIQNGGLPAGLGSPLNGGTKIAPGYVLYVGSLSKRKNFPGALETANRLARKRGCNFVFVGGNAGGIYETALKYSGRYQASPHLCWPNRRCCGSKANITATPRACCFHRITNHRVCLRSKPWRAGARYRVGYSRPKRALRQRCRLLRSCRY